MIKHHDLCGPDVTLVKCHKCEYQVPTDTLLRAHIVNRHRSKLTQRQREKRLQELNSRMMGEVVVVMMIVVIVIVPSLAAVYTYI